MRSFSYLFILTSLLQVNEVLLVMQKNITSLSGEVNLANVLCISEKKLLLTYQNLSFVSNISEISTEFFNETRDVKWCYQNFDINNSSFFGDENVAVVITAILTICLIVIIVFSLLWLLLVDRILSMIKIASVPSNSSLCSQNSELWEIMTEQNWEPDTRRRGGSFYQPYLETTSEESSEQLAENQDTAL